MSRLVVHPEVAKNPHNYMKYIIAGMVVTFALLVGLALVMNLTSDPQTRSDIYLGFEADEVEQVEVTVADETSGTTLATQDPDLIASAISGMREIKLGKDSNMRTLDASLYVYFDMKDGTTNMYYFEGNLYIDGDRSRPASNMRAFTDVVEQMKEVDYIEY